MSEDINSIRTADGATVKVGSVVYSYEGVERDVWENRDGEWWVLHHFLHFTHQNQATDCYSTKEAASQDWRNKLHRSEGSAA